MREIKFRAWHQELDQWVYYTTEDAFYSKVFNKDRSKWWSVSDASVLVNDSQYTDLRDNNGVDIYEDDIVEVDYLDLKINIYTVCFGDYMSEYYHMICWLLKNGENLLPLSLAVPCKVIGNIYENPDMEKVN